MEIRQLTYFVESARIRSFSEAARKLFTTQPNVSKAIKALEEELGVDLFYRKNTGIELTEEGKVVYLYAGNILKNVDRMNLVLEERKANGNGGSEG